MSNDQDTWSRLGDYFEEMADLTTESVKDLADEWAGLWNAEKEKGTTDSAMDAMKESVGVGFRATAKAWVATRKLMIDLAE